MHSENRLLTRDKYGANDLVTLRDRIEEEWVIGDDGEYEKSEKLQKAGPRTRSSGYTPQIIIRMKLDREDDSKQRSGTSVSRQFNTGLETIHAPDAFRKQDGKWVYCPWCPVVRGNKETVVNLSLIHI